MVKYEEILNISLNISAGLSRGREMRRTDSADRSYLKISEKGEGADAELSFTRQIAAILHFCFHFYFHFIIDPSGLRTIGTKRI